MTGSEILEMRNTVSEHAKSLLTIRGLGMQNQSILLRLTTILDEHEKMLKNIDARLAKLEEKDAEGREDRS